MKYQNGEDFLNHLNKNMHNEDIVMHTASKSDTPEEKIKKYMERLEKSHNKAKDNKHKMNILKQLYYNKYVIKTLPESYINLQKKIAHEQGYGNINITKEMKQEMLFQIQTEQKNSLNRWIEYFCSDDAMYPMWFKNYAFEGMLKLGVFDKEKKEFLKRTKNTSAPYIDLNREVLAQVYDVLIHQIGENKLSNLEEQALANGESFKKLYTYFLKKVIEQDKSQETEGIWIKYEQGSDYHPLLESLQGKNTGWCTAGETVAREQLENGDFYVYYTKDKNNEYKNPRIMEIIQKRNAKKDLSFILKVPENEIAIKLNDFEENKNIRFFCGDLNWTEDKVPSYFSKLQVILGNADFRNLTDSLGLESLQSIKGNALFRRLTNAEGLSSLQNIAGDAYFYRLTSSKGLKSLKNIEGDAYFSSLTSSKGLESLQNIGGNAYFSSLTSAEGLTSLQQIAGDANFDKLTYAKGLESLQNIEGDAYFDRLTSAEGLTSLQKIAGDANFDEITYAKGLESLQNVGGNAYFDRLTNAEGLTSLQQIAGNANFDKITYAKGLESLQNIGGNAFFYSLIKAEGLDSLQHIGKNAYFPSLINAIGLDSLQSIDGAATFFRLKSSLGLSKLQKIGETVLFDNLTDASELKSLQSVGNTTNQYVQKIIEKNNQTNIKHHH